MTAPLKAIDGTDDLAALMHDIGRRAKAAARVLALAPPEQKDRALAAIAKAIRADAAAIIAANAEDVAEARANGIYGRLPRPAGAGSRSGSKASPTRSRPSATSPIRSAR